MPRSLQNATRCACGIDIGTQQVKIAQACSTNTRLGGQPRTVLIACRRRVHITVCDFRRWSKHDCGTGHDDEELEHRVVQHRVPPAGIRDRALENRRPDRPGEEAAARNQRQRRAAPPVEPAADINVERRIDAAEAEQADEQAVTDVERQRRSVRRQLEPDRDHRGAADDGPAHADPLGDAAHQNAADTGAEPNQRAGKGRDRAFAVDLGGDVLERDHGDPRRAEGDRHDQKRGRGDDPRRSRFHRRER